MAPAQVHCSDNEKGEFTQVSCGGLREGGSGGGCEWGGLHRGGLLLAVLLMLA